MKFLRFLILILRKGSLQHLPLDYAAEREELLKPIAYHRKPFHRLTYRSKVMYTLRANLGYLLRAKQMNIQFFVSAGKKISYLRILKSASTSLLKEFLPHIDPQLSGQSLSDQQVDALAFRYVKKNLSRLENTFPKFALVRNPFHRLVSVYLDLFRSASPRFAYDTYWFGILKKDMSFEQVVDVVSVIPDFLKGPHFAPQHYMLCQATPLTNIQWYRIDKDQVTLQTFLNKDGLALPLRNKHESDYDFRSFYTAEILRKVYALYKADVKTFGYENEYQQLQQSIQETANTIKPHT